MTPKTDIIIIGGGPAGMSAAINARIRNKDVIIISNDAMESNLYKAKKIPNYLGMPDISGSEYLDKCLMHLESFGQDIIKKGLVLNILNMQDKLLVSYGTDVLMTKALILATGIAQSSRLEGEKELLGNGVSYCATCDGMLFRKKRVCVVGLSSEAALEANYLAEIGCEVTFIGSEQAAGGLSAEIKRIDAKKPQILGKDKVEALVADGEHIPCDGVFILRKTIAINTLLPGLETENGFIKVTRSMETSMQGVFAAGDCTGAPYQVNKAVGEGQIAALSAAQYLDKNY